MIKMEKKHIKPVSEMLVRAFGDDMQDLFPDPEERKKKHPYVSEFLLRRDFPSSTGFLASSQIEGVAIWMHSDKGRNNSLWRIFTSGAIWPAVKIGYTAFRKLNTSSEFMQKKHKDLISGKHWYLIVLAVDPQYQGKGYASSLLREMLNQIDIEGVACYLETEGDKNISIYKRFGFKVVDEYTIPGAKEVTAAMLREPCKGNVT